MFRFLAEVGGGRRRSRDECGGACSTERNMSARLTGVNERSETGAETEERLHLLSDCCPPLLSFRPTALLLSSSLWWLVVPPACVL